MAGNYIKHKKTKNIIEFQCTNAKVRVDICADDILRIRMRQGGEFKPDETYVVIRYDWPVTSCSIKDKGDFIAIETSRIQIKAFKSPFRFEFFDLNGKPVNKDWKEGSMGFRGNEIICKKELTGTDHFFGLGQRYEKSDLRGEKHDCWVTRHVTPVPFFMATDGYGIFFHNTFRSSFDFTTNPYSFSAPAGELDYYFIYGPQFKHILKQYTEITGRSPLPPKWAFGFVLSKWDQKFDNKVTYRQEGQDGMLQLVRACREIQDWPLDGIRIHSLGCNQNFYTSPNTKWGVGAWGEFYDVPQMVKQLHSWNCHAMFWENPGVMADCSMQTEGGQKRFLLEEYGKPWIGTFGYGPKEGSLIDFMNPAAREWWGEYHKYMVDFNSDGVAGDWTGNDHVNLGGDELSSPYNGMRYNEFHNILSQLYNQASYDAYKKYAPNKRSVVWGLAFWAGGQRYPMHGTQDSDLQEDAESIIGEMMGCINLGLSGIPFRIYTDNVSRFLDPKEPNVRLSQYLALTVAGERTEISATGHAVADDNYRYYAKLRYRLMPYIYSYAKETSQNGLPLVRSLVLEYQNDPQSYTAFGEYLMGKEILLAPLWSDTTFYRNIYLPEGEWIDFFNEKIYQGKQVINYYAPIDRSPIFVKAGSIIPMAPDNQHYIDEITSPLTIHIYPKGNSSFELYEDDGVSYDYERGIFSKTLYTCKETSGEIVVAKGVTEGGYKQPEKDHILCIHTLANVKNVIQSGRSLPLYSSEKELNASEEGWMQENTGKKLLWIKVKGEVTDAFMINVLLNKI